MKSSDEKWNVWRQTELNNLLLYGDFAAFTIPEEAEIIFSGTFDECYEFIKNNSVIKGGLVKYEKQIIDERTILTVKIMKSITRGSWYSIRIGETYETRDFNGAYYKVIGGQFHNHNIFKGDAREIKRVER